MPTKYQAQVKMTSESRTARLGVESISITPALNSDPVAKKPSPNIRRSAPQNYSCNSSEADVAILDATELAPADQSLPIDQSGGIGYAFVKRSLDVTLGSLLLIVAIPLVLLAAAAIRIDTPGSPFFFQVRVGKNGKPFKIFKLRGMYIDARVRFPKFYDYSAKRDLEFCFHHEHDPRVTTAGKFIRKTSIDELPNLWNVVLGDMSLVGPRPEIPEVMALYGSYRDRYLSVKPGLTCLSKCTGRDRLTKKETIEFDLNYIRNRSFAFDIKILWRTFRSVVTRRDVF